MTQGIPVTVVIRKQCKKALEVFDNIVTNTREIVRPGRSNSRNKKPKRTYSINNKRL